MRSLRRRIQNADRRGVAAVEMAVIAPIFLVLVFGIIEFGRYLMVGQLVTNAAREGARMAISGYFTDDQVYTDIENFVSESVNIDPEKIDIDIETESGKDIYDADAKELITIRVSVRFVDVTFLPWLGEGGGGDNDYLAGLRANHDDSKRISGISSMRKE